jgi:glucosamine--fructose-6-phosphate aminotransferase (isomerizing)
MCGIVAYIGNKDVSSVLMAGLWKLEYRGYDSCGIAILSEGEITLKKTTGRLMKLQEIMNQEPVEGTMGIGHTRWATHGEPSSLNAHPHLDCKERIAVVHNGIVENFYTLKERLTKSRHLFKSNTDTEVIPHLIEEHFEGNLLSAVTKSMKELAGSFAIAVISADDPERIVVAKRESPLILGLGEGENFVASDIPALAGHTNRVIVLDDNEIASITADEVKVYNLDGKEVEKPISNIPYSSETLEKDGYPHFMLKEIMEQPDVISKNISSKCHNEIIDFGEEFTLTSSELAQVSRIIIQACGTSWHAGYVAKYLLEDIARVHTEVDISSEFRYRNPVMSGETLVVAVSQSGETADTLAGLREAKAKFLKVLSFVNVKNSTIAREADSVIYIDAGPEIGVASTKAYTAEILSLYLFTLYLSRIKCTIHEEIVSKKLSN